MTEFFETLPTQKTFINMVVPDGEPCGCIHKKGCLDSLYCSCDCQCCLIQRRVDAGLTCYTCRTNYTAHFVEIPDIDGCWAHRDICTSCFKIWRTEMGFLDEEEEEEGEPDTPDNLTALSSITEETEEEVEESQ